MKCNTSNKKLSSTISVAFFVLHCQFRRRLKNSVPLTACGGFCVVVFFFRRINSLNRIVSNHNLSNPSS